jgi:hypothetical protein
MRIRKLKILIQRLNNNTEIGHLQQHKNRRNLNKNRTERHQLAFPTKKGNKFASWENHERETRTGGAQIHKNENQGHLANRARATRTEPRRPTRTAEPRLQPRAARSKVLTKAGVQNGESKTTTTTEARTGRRCGRQREVRC